MSVLTQPPVATEAVPTWPRIVATIAPGGPCQVAIDHAVHDVPYTTVARTREAVVKLVRQHAQDLGRPVRMDTVDPAGAFRSIVTPQGEVLGAEPDAPPTQVHPDQHVPRPDDAMEPTPPAAQHRSAPPASHAAPSSVAERARADAPPSPPAAPAESHTPVVEPAAPPIREVDPTQDESETPTLADLLGGRERTAPAPAQQGWRAGLRTITGGKISPRPGRAELTRREAIEAIAWPLKGPRTVVVVNPKGGAHKTTAALLLAANLGLHRGGSTLAWDNNETRGTMGWRAAQAPHTRTVIDLLADLQRLEGAGVRVGDLDAYVRAQNWGHFDVLASDEDANSADLVDGAAFERLHAALSRFYRVMVVDTGNNMRAPNWAAALAAADQLVIVSTIREDTSQSAAWLADALAATGHRDLVKNAVTVLTAPARTADPALGTRLHHHFDKLTRTVLSVPHDPALIAGGPIDYAALTPASRDAWLQVTAAVADGL